MVLFADDAVICFNDRNVAVQDAEACPITGAARICFSQLSATQIAKFFSCEIFFFIVLRLRSSVAAVFLFQVAE